jgi:ferrous iron transport protein B
MAFFALCAQCMATLATAKRETGSWKWAVFMFAYMTTLAYLAAVGINQPGKWISG